MKVVQAIRTALFYPLFIGQTALVAIVIGTVALVSGRTRLSWGLAVYWCRSSLVLLRAITGVRTKVSGAENIPPGGCIIAAKHQSDWDVFSIFPYTGRPAYIVKKELMRIPFFGWAARSLDCIEVDRKRGAEAIPLMMAQAHAAVERHALTPLPRMPRKLANSSRLSCTCGNAVACPRAAMPAALARRCVWYCIWDAMVM